MNENIQEEINNAILKIADVVAINVEDEKITFEKVDHAIKEILDNAAKAPRDSLVVDTTTNALLATIGIGLIRSMSTMNMRLAGIEKSLQLLCLKP